MSEAFSRIPAGLLVRYSDVQNVVLEKINNMSRKSPKDMVNIRLWMEEMRENKLHSILFSVDSDTNGTFLVSCISPFLLHPNI